MVEKTIPVEIEIERLKVTKTLDVLTRENMTVSSTLLLETSIAHLPLTMAISKLLNGLCVTRTDRSKAATTEYAVVVTDIINSNDDKHHHSIV
jgi:hypothetical protein